MYFFKLFLFLNLFFFIGCGGDSGGSKNDTVIMQVSDDYNGKLEQAVLSLDNSRKFIEASYYSDIFPLDEDGSKREGIIEENHIKSNGLGYINKKYVNYLHKNEVVANGNLKTSVLSISKTRTKAIVKIRVNMNVIYTLEDRKIIFKMIYNSKVVVTEYGSDVTEIVFEKYQIKDTKTNEIIEIVVDNKKTRLYVASEGYVEFNKDSIGGTDTFYGKNNTILEVSLKEEESIYEKREKIYTAKKGQGSIEAYVNGKKLKKIFYTTYKILDSEVPKIAEGKLIKFSLDSWNTVYRLLNEDSNKTEVIIEWFINGVKIKTKNKHELLKSEYTKDDKIKVRITATNKEVSVVSEQEIEVDANRYSSYWFHFDNKNIFDVIYRSDELTFDINLLNHEFFKNIDINNSEFSWKVELHDNSLDTLVINSGTENRQIPNVTFLNHNSYVTNLYLKVFDNHEVKTVLFKIYLRYGNDGYGNRPDIMNGVNEANLTGINKYNYIPHMIHDDLDKNGLEDIIYTIKKYESSTKKYYLNVSYQDSKREFEGMEPYLIKNASPSIYTFIDTGDFNGDGIMDVLVPSIPSGSVYTMDRNGSSAEIISLERGNFHLLKSINTSAVNILAVSDMNNDGKDDVLAYDLNKSRNIIYTDINNLEEKIILGENNRSFEMPPFIVDLNSDGLKDIVYGIDVKKVKDIYDIGYDDMLVVRYLYQMENSRYRYEEKNYRFKHFTRRGLSTRINKRIILDEHTIVLDIEREETWSNDINTLYTFDLNGDNGLTLLSQVNTNKYSNDWTYFKPIDVNHDGKKDLVSLEDRKLSILFQAEKNHFNSDYSYSLGLINGTYTAFTFNSILMDIDADGSVELMTVHSINKFSFVNLK